MVVARRWIDGFKLPQTLIQIHVHVVRHAERADAARRVANQALDILEGNHLGFGAKRILILAVIDFCRAFGENEDGFVALQKGHGLGNHAGLNAQRLRGFGDCRSGSGQLDDVIGVAESGKTGFCFFDGHGGGLPFVGQMEYNTKQ